eukprot:1972442-Pyramimonas_sp.AAC.1
MAISPETSAQKRAPTYLLVPRPRLGASWGPPGTSWGSPGTSWGLLGHPAAPGASWGLLEPPG